MHLKSLRSVARDERGSTLIAVVGLAMITAVVAVAVSTVSVNALATTGSDRAGVQAQAAAESGIAATVAALNTAACQVTYTRTSAPAYTVNITWSSSSTGPWTVGCPTTTSFIRLVSAGNAYTYSLGGLAAGRYVEAIYGYTPTPSAAIVPSGAAMYSYSASNTSISGLTLNAATSARPTVESYTGDITCASASTINGDVVAGGGNVVLTAGQPCIVNGNVSASGGVQMAGSDTVNGTVTAAGFLSDGYSFESKGSSTDVNGDIIAAGKVQVYGKATNVTAGPGTGRSIFYASGHISGNITVAGDLDANGMSCASDPSGNDTNSATAKCAMQANPKHVDGTITYGQSGITAPITPTVPGWVDYNYKASDWVGYNIVTLTTNDCNWSWSGSTGIAALNAAAASSMPTVLDARACSQISMWYTDNPVLHSNLVIVAGSFDLGSNTWTSNNTTQRDLWFITPDTTADGKPSCPGSNNVGNTGINGGFNVSGTVTGMVYTPCNISNSTTVWRGQMYSQNTIMNQNQTINYEPLGLPGVNLDAGSSGSGSSGSSGLGKLSATPTSYRDVASAG